VLTPLGLGSRAGSRKQRCEGTCASPFTRKHKRARGAILPSVSAENVEAVRRWLATLSASPEEIRTAVAELWETEADYYPVRKWPEARPCHDLEEVSQFLVRFADAFSRSEWAIRELIAVGDDRVLACLNLRAEGRGSGIRLEGDVYHCFWVRHGRFFHVEDHLTLSGALHALGLKGETLEAAGLRAPSNLDLVRSIYAAWERGDFSSVEWAHPDIELVVTDGPAPGSWTGLAGMAEGWRGLLGAWEELRVEADEYLEVDDGVLVIARWSGRGKTSGLELSHLQPKPASLFHIQGGKVTRLVLYLEGARALADLGLAPGASSRDA
jgi:ketosteroid isomerase-like protein